MVNSEGIVFEVFTAQKPTFIRSYLCSLIYSFHFVILSLLAREGGGIYGRIDSWDNPNCSSYRLHNRHKK